MSNLQELRIRIHQPSHDFVLRQIEKPLDLRPIGLLHDLKEFVLDSEGRNKSWLSFKQLREMLHGLGSLQVSFAIQIFLGLSLL